MNNQQKNKRLQTTASSRECILGEDMLRVSICDDDLDFLDSFARMITASFEAFGQQVKISAFSDGQSLVEKIEKEKHFFDIIFLDVEMPLHGFKVAQRLRELNTASILIFTTYMEHQSREGYLYGAFRYIFKNNLAVETNEAVSSIMKKLGHAAIEKEEITFKCRNLGVLENITLRKTDIIFLKAEKTRRVILKTVYAEYDLLVKSLAEYSGLLNSSAFGLILRSYLLNFNHVESIDNDLFVLTNGITVPLGIKREARQASMEKYLRFLEERI
ncbi:MAG: response regulator [Lachnospiraceae bacterium]|nr:response regulator [Lachnospiraceae bacterium]